MSQCYSVTATVKAKDEALFCDLAKKYIDEEAFEEGSFSNSDLSTPEGCVKAILAGDSQPEVYGAETRRGWLVCENAFEASYGWESVLCDWLCAVAPALEDGSRLRVSVDDGDWEMSVEDGKAVDTPVPTYTIDELTKPECDAYARLDAVDNLWNEREDQDEWDEERLVSCARRDGIRFYSDGRIAR